jgi:hypothetical protein
LGIIVFKIVSVLLRLGVALAPFFYIGFEGKINVGMFVGALFWFPIVFALMFSASEYKPKGGRRRTRKIMSPGDIVMKPLRGEYLRHDSLE